MTSVFKRESDDRTATVAKVDDPPGVTVSFLDRAKEGTYQVRADFPTIEERDAAYRSLDHDTVFGIVDTMLREDE